MTTSSSTLRPTSLILTKTFWVYATASVTLIVTTALVTYKLVEQDRRVKQRKHTKKAERQTLQLIHQIQLDRQTINKDIEGLTRMLLQKAKHQYSNDTMNNNDSHNSSSNNNNNNSARRSRKDRDQDDDLPTNDISTLTQTNDGIDRTTIATSTETTPGMDDKEWKRLEFIAAESNELLLRLLERLDAIRPKSAIMGDEDLHDMDGLTYKGPSALEEAAILEVRNRKRKVIRQIERNFRQLDQCKDIMNSLGGSGNGGGGD